MAHCDSPEDTLDPFTVVLCSNALDVYVAQLKPRANKVFSAAYAAIVVCPLPRSHPPPPPPWGVRHGLWGLCVRPLPITSTYASPICVVKGVGGGCPSRAQLPPAPDARLCAAGAKSAPRHAGVGLAGDGTMLCSSLSRCQSSSTDAKQSSGLTAASLSSSLIAR